MIDVQHGRQALAPAHSLTQHLQRGWSFLDADLGDFLEVLPAQQQVDGAWYKGTPNAVLQNLDIIHSHAPRHMLVLAGDHIYKMDYATLLAEHVARRADVSIAALRVPIDSASAFGIVTTADDDRITGFVEKPRQPRACVDDPPVAFASMGIYCFETGFLFDLLRSDARSTECSHVRDQLHPRTRRRPVLARRRHAGRTLQQQRPPAKFILGSPDGAGQTSNALVSSGCIISGAAVRNSAAECSLRHEQALTPAKRAHTLDLDTAGLTTPQAAVSALRDALSPRATSREIPGS
jgi:glucose-1-phosphate adenylyltransferase